MRSFIRKNNLLLSLIGSSYEGVSVNDVIFSGRQAVEELFGVEVWQSWPTQEQSYFIWINKISESYEFRNALLSIKECFNTLYNLSNVNKNILPQIFFQNVCLSLFDFAFFNCWLSLMSLVFIYLLDAKIWGAEVSSSNFICASLYWAFTKYKYIYICWAILADCELTN